MALVAAAAGARTAPNEYRSLKWRLAQVRRRAKTVIFADATARALFVFVAAAPIAFLLDNFLHLPLAARVILLGALAGGVAAVFVRRARTALPRWSDERVARRIEEAYPELNNRLINALQLGRHEPDERTAAVIARVIQDAAQYSSRMSFGDAVRLKRLLRAVAALAVVGVAASAYPLLFYDYFANAAERILFPVAAVAPLTQTILSVTPGHDLRLGRGDTLDVLADVKPGTRSPRQALIDIREEGRTQSAEMRFDGERFLHRVSDIQNPFQFRVKANDFSSPWRRVTPVDKPRVESFHVAYNFPEYTGLKPAQSENTDGAIRGLIGTRVEVTALTSKPVTETSLAFSTSATTGLQSAPFTATIKDAKGKERQVAVTRLQTSFALAQNDAYRIRLTDNAGFTNEPAPSHAIIVYPDEAPRVAITSPSGETEAEPGSKLSALFSCSDDYGLAEVFATLREAGGAAAAGGKEKRIYEAKPQDASKRLQGGFDVDLSGWRAGAQLALQLFARDANPANGGSLAESEIVTIRVVSKVGAAQEAKAGATEVMQRLAALLAEQKDARDEAGRLARRQAEGKLTAGRADATLPRLERSQDVIKDEAKSIAGAIAGGDAELAPVKTALSGLADGPMTRAPAVFAAAQKASDMAGLGGFLKEALGLQDEIVAALEKLLANAKGGSGVNLDKKDEKKASPEFKPGEKVDQDKARKYVEGLIEKLNQFKEFDHHMIEATRELAGKKPEDLTKNEEDKLNDLVANKEDWTQFMRGVFTDLSRLSEVKPVDTAQVEEIVEVYSEIELRPDDQRTSKTEIFTPAESNGLELASELQANLEKWLNDEPDALKWNMEEPETPAEPPLCELPQELEDLIGDLLESEENMSDDVEDVSSSYADSLDKGAGWATMDGPISNFSAQGKTGNMMPNNDELTGRSGEGRTGKSNGEFVEQQAFGKGGRKTPTRLGDESYENGKVEDFSKDPTGGATGGGKESGVGAKGLTSPHAAPMDNTQQRLLKSQAGLKMKAADLQQMLANQRLPNAKVAEAIARMGQLEQAVAEKRYDVAPRIHEQVISDLQANRAMVNKQLQANREKVQKLPPRFNDNIAQGAHDEFPEGYEDMLKAYYKRLSEAMY